MWCLRHAESTDNVARVLSSRVPGADLTDRGRAQAAEVAELLAAEPIVAVYASPAVRAMQTAAPIAVRFGLDVRTRPDLVEWDLGEYEGRSDDEARAACLAVARAWIIDRDLDVRLPGGDSGRELAERCVSALTEIAEAHPGQTVALVSHGGALAAGLLAVAGFASDAVWGRPLAHAKAFLVTYSERVFGCDGWPGEPVVADVLDPGGSLFADPQELSLRERSPG
jgi:broad specificity phosphatase PhoE